MTGGALWNSRYSIFDRTRVALHQDFDQHRRLTEILFWLAAFVPELRNDELVDCITFRHRYAHHDATVRAEYGDFPGCSQEVGQVWQSLGMRLQFWNRHSRILVIRRGYKQINPAIRTATLFE